MKSKILSALLSLAIAFGLWVYVITVVSPESEETYDNIPVILEGKTVLTERGLMITEGENASVSLRLKGNRSDLVKLNRGNITLKVDLSKIYEPGNHQLNYSISYPGDVPNGAVSVENRSPATIALKVERRVTAQIPVEAVFSGSVPDGFISDPENAVLDPLFVTVKGPASVVEQIAKARIEVDLDDQNESISQSYAYTLCDESGDPVDVALVETDVAEIRLDLKIQRVKEIKLTYTIVEGGGATAASAKIEVKPAKIKVSGSDTVLEGLDEINLGTIDLSEIIRATQLSFPINLPDGVTNLTGVTDAAVDIRFEGLTVKEFTIENIQAINVPEGLEFEFLTEVLKVTLRGPTEQINALSVSNIVVSVDFSGKEVGTSTMKATITINGAEYSGVGAVGTYSVSVTLRVQEKK